ncbi:MAG: hypothetical protein WCO14_01435 [bacterium]
MSFQVIATVLLSLLIAGCSNLVNAAIPQTYPAALNLYSRVFSEQQYSAGQVSSLSYGDLLVTELEPAGGRAAARASATPAWNTLKTTAAVASSDTGATGYDEFRLTLAKPASLGLCILSNSRTHLLRLYDGSGKLLASKTAQQLTQSSSTDPLQPVALQAGDYTIRITADRSATNSETMLVYLGNNSAPSRSPESRTLMVTAPPVYDLNTAYPMFSLVSYNGKLYINGRDAAPLQCPVEADCPATFSASLWSLFDPELVYEYGGFISHSSLSVLENGINVVRLKGSYFEMGWQYGHHLKVQLKKWADYYNTTWKEANPKFYNALSKMILEWTNRLYMSPKMKSFLAGMSFTSGLSPSDIYMLNQCLAFDYAFSEKIGLLPGASCTFVGAYGSATNGRTIVGRNLDLQRSLAVRDYNSVVTVMQPANGDHRIATFGFVGFPQGYALLNLDNTVFVEYNTGNSSDYGMNLLPGSRDMINLAFEAVTEKSNIDAATTASYLRTAQLLSPAFFGVADRGSVLVVERPSLVKGTITRDSIRPGINGVTNAFINAYGPLRGPLVHLTVTMTVPDDNAPDKIGIPNDTPAKGIRRWLQLNDYFNKQTGLVGIETIKAIVSLNIEEKGVFITGYETNDYFTCKSDTTFGSVVMDLSDLQHVWWLRYDYATMNKTWDSIDLTRYTGPDLVP